MCCSPTVFIVLLGLLSASLSASPQAYQILPEESRIGFSVRHFFTAVEGTFDAFEGRIFFSPANPPSSSATARIDARSINTDNRERDEHLRNEDFFHTERYPHINFVSTEWVQDTDSGEGHYAVNGILTMRGQSHPVSLLVRYIGKSEIEPGLFRSRWVVNGSLNRSLWKVDYGKGVVGTTVEVEFEITAVSVLDSPQS